MKTINATQQEVYSVETDKMPHVPAGKVRVYTVQYRTFEIDAQEFKRMQFHVHDRTQREAILLARVMRG